MHLPAVRHHIYRADDFAGGSGSASARRANHAVSILAVVADLALVAAADGPLAKRSQSLGNAWADELSASGTLRAPTPQPEASDPTAEGGIPDFNAEWRTRGF